MIDFARATVNMRDSEAKRALKSVVSKAAHTSILLLMHNSFLEFEYTIKFSLC